MDEVECVVVGAGVVGLAVARALARAGREVLILEREGHFGSGISSRNSEVIHAGLYYPKGSLKAASCVAGKHALYRHCVDYAVPHRRCGKLIVASDPAQAGARDGIATAAAANGVDDLVWLTGAEARALEPELAAAAALLSPSTGIIDSHAFMLSLLGDAEAHGAMIAYGVAVTRFAVEARGIAVSVAGQEGPALRCQIVINSAGLHAPALAQTFEGFPQALVPKAYYAKGSYFALAGRSPFQRLIYPIPEPGGLGVHLTLDLGGQAKFGPDVEWVEEPLDYDVDPARGDRFYAAVRAYWPGLRDGALSPAYAGVRPKIAARGAPDADFLVQGPAQHGVPGVAHLFGIESPGLTAALALGDHVAGLFS